MNFHSQASFEIEKWEKEGIKILHLINHVLRNDDGKFQQVLQQNNNNKVKNVGPKGHFHALATATASLISFIKML